MATITGGDGDVHKSHPTILNAEKRDRCNGTDAARKKRSPPDSNIALDPLSQLIAEKQKLEKLGFLGLLQTPGLLDREIDKLKAERFMEVTVVDLPSKEKPKTKEIQGNFVGVKTEDPVRPLVVEKYFLPIDSNKYKKYNFAGRLLGPQGLTVRHLEQKTGCRIQVRGKGSKKNITDENGEEEDLHAIISVKDTDGRAQNKITQAKFEIEKLLKPEQDDMDELKKKQLMELAIMNGTYRPPTKIRQEQRIMQPKERNNVRTYLPARNIINIPHFFFAPPPVWPMIGDPLNPSRDQVRLPFYQTPRMPSVFLPSIPQVQPSCFGRLGNRQ